MTLHLPTLFDLALITFDTLKYLEYITCTTTKDETQIIKKILVDPVLQHVPVFAANYFTNKIFRYTM